MCVAIGDIGCLEFDPYEPKSKVFIETGNTYSVNKKEIDFHYDSCERSYVAQCQEINIQVVLSSSHGNEAMLPEQYASPHIKLTNLIVNDTNCQQLILVNNSVILDVTINTLLYLESGGKEDALERIYYKYNMCNKKNSPVFSLPPSRPLISFARIIEKGIIFVDCFTKINTYTGEEKVQYHNDCDILDLQMMDRGEKPKYLLLDCKSIQIHTGTVSQRVNLLTLNDYPLKGLKAKDMFDLGYPYIVKASDTNVIFSSDYGVYMLPYA